MGLTPLPSEECNFSNSEQSLFVCVYLDDFLVTSKTKQADAALLNSLASSFELKVTGEPEKFLGLTIKGDRRKRLIVLSLEGYADELLQSVGMTEAKSVSTPMVHNSNLVPPEADKNTRTQECQRLVESLMYMDTAVRPDLAYTVSTLAMFMSAPEEEHWKALEHLFRYLVRAGNDFLTLGSDNINLTGYADASFGDLHNGIFYMGDFPVSWAPRKQKLVTLSTTEAEYLSLTESAKEALWLISLLHGFAEQSHTLEIRCDNKSTLAFTQNNELHLRTKHINSRHHFIREQVSARTIKLRWISSADIRQTS